MLLNEQYRRRVIISYVLVFFIIAVFKLAEGQLLSQFRPLFIVQQHNPLQWLFVQTGVPQLFVDHPFFQELADLFYYTAPMVLLGAYVFNRRFYMAAAVYMLFVNWFYVHLFILFPTNSIEGHIAWLLFPFVFLPPNLITFNFLFKGLRYFFLFFFASAAIWKLVQGGLFNTSQMSAILLDQHKELLITQYPGRQADIFMWLINNPSTSYWIYVAGFAAELSFIIGFFTQRFDKWLAAIFIAFLVADFALMRISYLEVAPFLITLYYTKPKS